MVEETPVFRPTARGSLRLPIAELRGFAWAEQRNLKAIAASELRSPMRQDAALIASHVTSPALAGPAIAPDCFASKITFVYVSDKNATAKPGWWLSAREGRRKGGRHEEGRR